MKIYDLNNKELRSALRKFSKTTYGKVVFITAYTVSMLLIIGIIVLLLLGCNNVIDMFKFSIAIYIMISGMFISFMIGNAYFYCELKGFVEHSYKK